MAYNVYSAQKKEGLDNTRSTHYDCPEMLLRILPEWGPMAKNNEYGETFPNTKSTSGERREYHHEAGVL
jgi:hypothetical protein